MSTIKDVMHYWDEQPCNIRRSSEQPGSPKWCYETQERKYISEPHIKYFADFNSWKNKKVLEIGCGIGIASCSFAKAGAEVTAVDLSEKSLALAQERMKVYELSVQFFQANAEELNKVLFQRMYDLIYSFGVLHHTPNPEKAFREITNFMGPHSIFKLMVYNKYSWKVLWILFKYGHGAFWKLDQLIAENSEAAFGCPVTFVYSKKEIKKILTECGYKSINIKVDHIFPYSVPEYKKYEYKKVWYFRWLPHFLFRALEKTFGWHLLIEAKIMY